jgi:hypothetical protein
MKGFYALCYKSELAWCRQLSMPFLNVTKAMFDFESMRQYVPPPIMMLLSVRRDD